jgi:hypothetical protein
MFEDRIIFPGPVRDRGDQILDDIARQGKLGEDDEIRFLLFGLLYVFQMLCEISFDIPKFCCNLCESKVQFHRPNLTIK